MKNPPVVLRDMGTIGDVLCHNQLFNSFGKGRVLGGAQFSQQLSNEVSTYGETKFPITCPKEVGLGKRSYTKYSID